MSSIASKADWVVLPDGGDEPFCLFSRQKPWIGESDFLGILRDIQLVMRRRPTRGNRFTEASDIPFIRNDPVTPEPDLRQPEAGCGIPETLVHGDFHPGNWRFDGHSLVLLDWGGSGIGHPMLDLSAFEEGVPDEVRPRVRATWVDAWRAECPGSDPSRATELIAPLGALRRAVIYQGFLDGIEPSERRYHESDVSHWLREALEWARASADQPGGSPRRG